MTIYNIYCDESCHLEHDGHRVMVLGAVWCPAENAKDIADRIREIKERHDLPPHFEVKWTKVSKGRQRFYLDLVDYFFDDDDLSFRALVVPDKSALRHEDFGQDHDLWYYKMYFDMLKVLLAPQDKYRIYLDLKDTRGGAKVRKLHEVLNRAAYDFRREIVERMQLVHSHEVQQLQLADLLIGCVGYANRELSGSPAKVALVKRVQSRSRYSLQQTTLLRERKMNIFVWHHREVQG